MATITTLRADLDTMLEHGDVAEGGEHRDVLEAYRMFAHDRGWVHKLEEAVLTGLTAEAAVERVQSDTRARMLRQTDPFLRERLPDSMVPSTFTLLDELPLTPNRKVDRKALPVPQRQDADEAHVAPRTPVEEVLASIWAELLGLERVGATDHFFDLGGHSLLGTRVMSRLRETFGVELPLRDLFVAPRLSDLAARTCAVFNLTGQPALSLPAGTVAGLPVGLTVAGRIGGDAPLMALAAAYERATGWWHSLPLTTGVLVEPGHQLAG